MEKMKMQWFIVFKYPFNHDDMYEVDLLEKDRMSQTPVGSDHIKSFHQ